MNSKAKAKKKWVKPRHKIVTNIAYTLVAPYARWRYKVDIEPFREVGDRQYLILLNHQTPFDQFFVGISFKKAIYYMATEDIFSLGWVSSLIRFLVAPIPIKKQTSDVAAVKTCVNVAKEGGSIAIAPEGNRTYSGKTEYMNPSIASLAKILKLPIVLYRIEGGYGTQPRWSDVIRKGRMRAYVSRVIEPEEYKSLSTDELFTLIEEGLYVNEANSQHTFHHKKSAEYLERALYVCPYCGLSEFESHGDRLTCKHCNRQVQFLPTTELKGIDFDLPFQYVNDWYEYQCDFINKLDTRDYLDAPMYRDKARLSEVIIKKRKQLLEKSVGLALYGDRVVFDNVQGNQLVLPFEEVTAAAVLGRNKLNLYHGQKVYQIKGDKRFNALKYVNIYFRHKNITKENYDGKFLGL